MSSTNTRTAHEQQLHPGQQMAAGVELPLAAHLVTPRRGYLHHGLYVELPRGPNNVIEFWIENAVMIELMTPAMARDYVAAMKKNYTTSFSDRKRS